jgi:hypothetical protein
MSSSVRDTGWRGRLEGIVPPQVDDCRVLIAGCGSVGSFIASELARHGVRRFTLVDPDTVEWSNLTRTVYGHRDIGRNKTEALGDHLRSIFDDIEVDQHTTTLQGLGAALRPAVTGAHLIIGAMDDPAGTGRLNRYAYGLGVPALFVGLYRGARGGEVVMTQPGLTSCFSCATGGVREVVNDVGAERVSRDRDYGTSRLVAEVALGCDIHHVCTAAVKLALSMLASREPSAALGRFAGAALEKGSNFLLLGMTPDYFLFPSTHKDTVGQHAFQSLWLATASRQECSVCGEPGNREALD